MAKISISKDLILSIANKNSKTYVKGINDKVNALLTASVSNLATQVSYISLENTVLQPVNELFSDSMVDNSEFVYVLGVESAQLDLNTIKKSKIWEIIKTRAKIAWQSRKYFRKRKRKRRKKQKEEVEPLNIQFDPSKYTVYSLTEDLQRSIAQYLSPTSIVYQGNNKLEILGKEDFGPNVRIIIYVVSLVNKELKYYAGKRKNPFINLALNQRYLKLKAKKKSAGKNFIKVMKVFNALYFNVNGHMPNQLFLESVMCNCPDDIFVGDDFYKVFIKVVNYLSVRSLRNTPSILNEELTIFEDKRCGDSGFGLHKILSTISTQEEQDV
ncbi:MAG: hypothetical protein IJY90_01365 [Clostridia bacterium]|nr:hypothetical protein [Clostridia bacterium]